MHIATRNATIQEAAVWSCILLLFLTGQLLHAVPNLMPATCIPLQQRDFIARLLLLATCWPQHACSVSLGVHLTVPKLEADAFSLLQCNNLGCKSRRHDCCLGLVSPCLCCFQTCTCRNADSLVSILIRKACTSCRDAVGRDRSPPSWLIWRLRH